MSKASWVAAGSLVLMVAVSNCGGAAADDAPGGAGRQGVAGANEAGAPPSPDGGGSGDAGSAGHAVGGSGNASSIPGDGYAGDCGIPGAAGALPTDGEQPPASCYSAGGGCMPCCPTKTPDCANLPDQYPGYECVPAPGKSPDLSFCVCQCSHGDWLCAC